MDLDRHDDEYVLRISDTGVGIPAGPDPEQASSLGLRLVHLLAKRLYGSLAVQTDAGTTFTLTFPGHPPE